MTEPDGAPVRLDVWLWAVRIFKTRSHSAEAVRAGHVKLGGVSAKPAAQVVPGDHIRVWKDHRYLEFEVTGTVRKRVGAPVARTMYVDKSPPPPPRDIFATLPVRDRGAGRPTKKDRRAIDRLRGF
ncbi:RNA-binding S4 domain-containing protein [Corynebacterium sanguinis]|uniref:RNA-binding S4 domain-containing protein n=1 Tax=Corynebacterium sanguinis TaxID=2594913 RepID=UPI00223B0FAF|nr:RNA-binding S4 domain-containing protein [Corynebacterium sanguinis]MCT1499023.1 RNA-binding S4 domain-containing protein [Corynebacterium sanguinis]